MKPFAGPVTLDMTDWARAIVRDEANCPLGFEERRAFCIGGKGPANGTRITLLARVERHTWTYRDGVRVTGEFRGVTLYAVEPE